MADAMADPDHVRELREDNQAMLDLLRRHGLLYRLPHATLRRTRYRNDVEEFANQIKILTNIYGHDAQRTSLSHSLHLERRARSLFEGIKNLALYPGGKVRAMSALVELNTKFTSSNMRQMNDLAWYDREGLDYEGLSMEIDRLLAGVAHRSYTEALGTNTIWDCQSILTSIELSIGLLQKQPHWSDWSEDLRRYYLVISSWYMRKCHKRNVAHILSLKVAGPWLPPELTELVRECIYDDDADLTICPTKWQWYHEDGERRSSPRLVMDCGDDDEGSESE